jgi:cell division septation protein DedD
LASLTPDDGFHEIQLNGKQLVFLFMAATVVSVVIFLCGVLVGRGVRSERQAALNDAAPASIEPTPQPAVAEKAPAGSDPTAAATPPPTVDDLSYFNRLEKQTQPPEELKATSAAEKAPTSAVAKAPASTFAAAKAPATVDKTVDKPVDRGDGYVIQVAAIPEHGVADAMAKRLSSKGYSAFVMTADGAKPTMYRVRIGKFKTKREAETVAARLQKEEQFKPWITR